MDPTTSETVDLSSRVYDFTSDRSSMGSAETFKSADSREYKGAMSTRAIFSLLDSFAETTVKSPPSVEFDDDNVSVVSKIRSRPSVSFASHEELGSDFLSELEAVAIMSVLDDAVDRMNILGAANKGEPHVPQFLYQSLEERFRHGNIWARIIDVHTDQPMHQAIHTTALKKLLRDAAFVEKVLSQTLSELKTNGSFKTLVAMVAQESFVKEEEDRLLEEEKINSAAVQTLMKELQDERADNNQRVQEMDEVIAKLKDEYQENYFQSKMKYKFVNMWEGARKGQNTFKHLMKENGLQYELDHNGFCFDVERRVHAEIEDFIRLSQAKLEENIEEWISLYEREMDLRDVALNQLRQDRSEHYKKFEDLALQYQHHKNEIEEYLEVRAKRERRLMRELFLNNMATRIQAWWRGNMVRHMLGPYRKKKGKGKEKGKGGKDKKGKKK